MNKKRLTILIALFVFCFSFNAFAMKDLINGEFVPDNPGNEVRYEDKTLGSRWTWLNDDICVQFSGSYNTKRAGIQRLYDNGLIRRWGEPDGNGGRRSKSRDTYAGKWSQSEDGIWSFEFDDKTIPLGVTKIDDVLYAFNGYGELKEGYEYYDGLTTGADGVVNSDNPDFLAWLETQYVPACTSHE